MERAELNVVYVALFAALMVVLGLIPKLDLVSGVPITAQSMGVMLAGAVLGAKRGALAVLLFLVLVVLGFPVLAGGRGGIGAFVTPAAGFIIGWPVGAWVTGLVMSSRGLPGNSLVRGLIASFTGGVVVIYAFGIPGMSLILDKTMVEAMGFALPFIPGDLIKVVITGLVVQSLHRMRPRLLPPARS